MVVAPNVVRTIKTSKGDVAFSVYDLLEEIRCRPSIWQVNGIGHISRTDFNNSWRSIAQILISHFNQLDQEEQNKITQTLKNLYGTLKNYLTLSVKYKKSGDKRYRLFNYGRNMDYVLQDRGMKLEEIYSQEELNEMETFERRFKQNYAPKSLPNHNLPEEILQRPGGRRNITDYTEEEKSQSFSHNSYDGYSQCGVEIDTNERPYIRQKCKSKDPDQAFFDSLKPWLRKMNETQKLDFKIEFLEILKKHQT